VAWEATTTRGRRRERTRGGAASTLSGPGSKDGRESIQAFAEPDEGGQVSLRPPRLLVEELRESSCTDVRWAGWPAIDVYIYIPVYPFIPLLCFMHHTFKPHEAIYTLAHLKNK